MKEDKLCQSACIQDANIMIWYRTRYYFLSGFGHGVMVMEVHGSCSLARGARAAIHRQTFGYSYQLKYHIAQAAKVEVQYS